MKIKKSIIILLGLIILFPSCKNREKIATEMELADRIILSINEENEEGILDLVVSISEIEKSLSDARFFDEDIRMIRDEIFNGQKGIQKEKRRVSKCFMEIIEIERGHKIELVDMDIKIDEMEDYPFSLGESILFCKKGKREVKILFTAIYLNDNWRILEKFTWRPYWKIALNS